MTDCLMGHVSSTTLGCEVGVSCDDEGNDDDGEGDDAFVYSLSSDISLEALHVGPSDEVSDSAHW